MAAILGSFPVVSLRLAGVLGSALFFCVFAQRVSVPSLSVSCCYSSTSLSLSLCSFPVYSFPVRTHTRTSARCFSPSRPSYIVIVLALLFLC